MFAGSGESHLKIKHFELPLAHKIDLDAHLKSHISCWLLKLFGKKS